MFSVIDSIYNYNVIVKDLLLCQLAQLSQGVRKEELEVLQCQWREQD
jgi:hypothetical protein